jgi:V8-like Glu-specific endopeptidase
MSTSKFSMCTRAALAAGVCSLALIAAGPRAGAEPAPAPFHVLTGPTATDETRAALTARSAAEPREVRVPQAEWLQIEFGEFNLGATGKLTIEDVGSGQTQTFTQEQLEAWEGQSAIFRSNHLRLSTEVSADEAGEIFYEINQILVGEPLEGRRPETPPGGEERSLAEESQCGANDDRQPSTDARVGRIMPVGCTGWIVGENTFLTAGHCVGNTMRILEFNVPASNADGTTNPALVRDQYAIVQNSIVFNDDGAGQIGDDWAVFRVAPNTQTGLLPNAAQGAQFTRSHSLNPSQVRVTGHGVDNGTANQTQQTHSGEFLGVTVEGVNDAFMEYTADTEGGNSGSPVFDAGGGGVAVGIHTNAGCNPPNQGNTGTSFRNARLWQTINQFTGPWAVGTFSPWAGYAIPNGLWLPADINGDGRTDIVHAVQDTDYVHTWISNGNGTFTVGTFSPWAGYGIPNGLWLPADINGDGRTDIVHAVQGTDYVHTWVSNGDGTFSVGTFKPWDGYAIPNGLWLPANINGDDRTDIVHAVQDTDYVHTWISNGNGTPTVETFSPWPGYAIPNGLWLPVDLNGDGRTDIVHAVQGTDYVHTWIAR